MKVKNKMIIKSWGLELVCSPLSVKIKQPNDSHPPSLRRFMLLWFTPYSPVPWGPSPNTALVGIPKPTVCFQLTAASQTTEFDSPVFLNWSVSQLAHLWVQFGVPLVSTEERMTHDLRDFPAYTNATAFDQCRNLLWAGAGGSKAPVVPVSLIWHGRTVGAEVPERW
jgi:hypothetical protein